MCEMCGAVWEDSWFINLLLVSGVLKGVVLLPGLPASATVPHSTKRGKPVGVSMRAVIKVGSDSVWWKLPQLLLLLWQKTNEAILIILKYFDCFLPQVYIHVYNLGVENDWFIIFGWTIPKINFCAWFLLCLRKSWSEGPIWGCAAAPEVPSRGSSCSQGGTAPTTHEG